MSIEFYAVAISVIGLVYYTYDCARHAGRTAKANKEQESIN